MSALKGALEHAKRHVEYPTSKKALVEACNNFSDIPREDKEWFEKNLPERAYSEPVEVFKALLDKVRRVSPKPNPCLQPDVVS